MRYLSFFVGLILTVNGLAQSGFTPIANQDEVKVRFVESAKNMRTIKSEFIQEKYLAYLSSTVISKGKLWYKKENHLRWEYIDPFNYVVLVNGDKVTLKDNNNTSAYKNNPNKTFQELNKILAGSVSGNLIDNPDFDFKVAQNAESYQIILIPKTQEAKAIFNSIELLFNKKSMVINSLKMNEPDGNYIKLIFNQLQLNTAIDDAIFSL